MDREKVINDLQDAVNDDWMWQHADYYAKAMENALALLKEREPVKPKSKARHGENAQYQHFCGNCMAMLFGKPKFCSNCGRAVKWE